PDPAGSAGVPDHGDGCLRGPGRLRQADRHLWCEVRQCRELPGLPAHPGPRCRATLRHQGWRARGGSAVTATDPGRVIAVARSWLGTPYHDQASLKGVGCDCLGLARGVWREVVGPEPFPIPPYSRDWGETGPREVLADGARAMMPEVARSEERRVGKEGRD